MKDKHIIEWVDPADNNTKYLALSADTGHYWTEDVDDPLIIDTSDLPIKHTVEDTILQISEKWKMQKGRQYERYNLHRHPDPKIHAWLAVEKLPDGTRDAKTNKVNRTYQAYWTRKFKIVSCISKITGKGQGNPKMQDKEYAKANSVKAREQRKRKLANAQETAKKLNFDPMQRLALYAMGDKDRLGLKDDVKQSIQMKALTTYLEYSHQKMKPYSPQEMDKLRMNDSGPKINIVLPSDGSENKQHVIEHKDQQSLDEYLQTGALGCYDEIDQEVNESDEEFEGFRLDLPDED